MFKFLPQPDGGVMVRLCDHYGNPVVEVGLNHQQALNIAASVLGHAGVTMAEFEDGRLTVLQQG